VTASVGAEAATQLLSRLPRKDTTMHQRMSYERGAKEVAPSHHVCQADSTCGNPPRFQARLEAVNGTQSIRQDAEACAGHLTEMVQAITTWAHDQHLTEGQLTVLAIGSPSGGSCLLVPADHDRPETVALAFSTIRLTE
jgi:hypothetical protein